MIRSLPRRRPDFAVNTRGQTFETSPDEWGRRGTLEGGMEPGTQCDQCPALARVHLTLIPSMGVLTLCGHHGRKVQAALENAGAEYEAVEQVALEV